MNKLQGQLMETVLYNGNRCHTCGYLPAVGAKAPCYNLVKPDLNEINCVDFQGKRVVLNVFPSLDTPVCATSVRRFNEMAAQMDNTVVLCISMDLPFAAARFCSAENIKNVTIASAFRSPLFAETFGVGLVDGPLAGLLARAVVVLDGARKVIYSELVKEIANEPNYDEVLKALAKK
jgi:thiol peroxidase